MLINLSDAFAIEGFKKVISASLEADSFINVYGEFPFIEKNPVSFEVENISNGKASLKGKISFKLKTVCDRCLTDTITSVDVEFDEIAYAPSVEYSDDDDPVETEGYQLDAERFITQMILSNWPMKILCTEECKGVCPVCGANRNEKECDCDTFVPDPRMAAIKDIFKHN